MSQTQKTSLKRIFLLLLIAGGLFLLFLAGGMIASLPERAEELFGPPDPSLSGMRLYYQSTLLIIREEDLKTPLDPYADELTFTILPGESPDQIIRGLRQADLIDHPNLFRTYLVYSGMDRSIQAGEYTLSGAMSPYRIAQTLQDATPEETSFTIIAGWRSEEIAAALPVAGLEVSQDDFLAKVKEQSAEGHLFPATYQLPRNASAAELVAIFERKFQEQLTPKLESGFEKNGFSLQQAVILASIVERETVVQEEMPLIASVFINRLKAEMTLSADPTVQYALGFNEKQNTWWTNPLSKQDLQVSSPYNTYRNPGLPPGPICNPSLAALQAVAFPAESPYYYFRAACDSSGEHLFSRTFEEHLNKGCK